MLLLKSEHGEKSLPVGGDSKENESNQKDTKSSDFWN